MSWLCDSRAPSPVTGYPLYCTLDAGHLGFHAAHGLAETPLHTWGEAGPPPFCHDVPSADQSAMRCTCAETNATGATSRGYRCEACR